MLGSGRMAVEMLSKALYQREENLGFMTTHTTGSQLQHTTVGQQAITVANQVLSGHCYGLKKGGL